MHSKNALFEAMFFKRSKKTNRIAELMREAEAAAAYKLKMSPHCTICGHEAGQHYKFNPWYNVYNRPDILAKDGHAGCLAYVWKPGEFHGKSYEKSVQCDCPLTPDEVLHNVEKAKKPIYDPTHVPGCCDETRS